MDAFLCLRPIIPWKHIYFYYLLIKENTCRILFPYSTILQPDTWLHFAIPWQTITHEIRHLKPYRCDIYLTINNHGNIKYFNIFSSTIHSLDRPHLFFLTREGLRPLQLHSTSSISLLWRPWEHSFSKIIRDHKWQL